MKYLKLTIALFFANAVFAQDGKIIDKQKIQVNIDTVINIKSRWNALAKKYYNSVDIYRITYISDGFHVLFTIGVETGIWEVRFQ